MFELDPKVWVFPARLVEAGVLGFYRVVPYWPASSQATSTWQGMATIKQEDDSVFDKDGYPTEEALERLANWDIIAAGGLEEFLEYLRRLWWQWERDWGFICHGRQLSLHTGGWSGNESVIEVLQNSPFWTMYWRASFRGGHYEFELPKEEK